MITRNGAELNAEKTRKFAHHAPQIKKCFIRFRVFPRVNSA